MECQKETSDNCANERSHLINANVLLSFRPPRLVNDALFDAFALDESHAIHDARRRLHQATTPVRPSALLRVAVHEPVQEARESVEAQVGRRTWRERFACDETRGVERDGRVVVREQRAQLVQRRSSCVGVRRCALERIVTRACIFGCGGQ